MSPFLVSVAQNRFMISFFRKSHKWLGIGLSLFLLLFAASGIVLNHRRLFSAAEVNRQLMPEDYHFTNWNNASVRGSLRLSPDSILVYGNIGIWLTSSDFSEFEDFNQGFGKGIDKRKVSAVCMLPSGELYAGTYFGLFRLDRVSGQWQEVAIPVEKKRITDLSLKGDSLLVLTRSELLIRDTAGAFHKKDFPPPRGYDNKVGLFKTLWVVHSGEIYGLVGKIIVDAIGLIFVFLTITGLVFFVNRYRIRSRKKRGKERKRLSRTNRWSLKWHNKIGWTTLALLLLTTITGMFLRPPLLIAIASKKVIKIPGTKLDSPQAWFDQLRAIRYDEAGRRYLLATSGGFYQADLELRNELEGLDGQPPLSVMGINVFEELSEGSWLVGSFSGLFIWEPDSGKVVDRISMETWKPEGRPGRPIGRNMATGLIRDYQGGMAWFDYNRGALMLDSGAEFPAMPEKLARSPMSLWNLALEVHTGRIYKPVFGMFYILVVPLVGLLTLFMSVSGFIVWYKQHRRSKKRL